MEAFNKKDLKHNYIVNLFDGGFFGFAMGFASFSTVLPLFVSTMTSSAILIGLIPAIHNMGWQFPQLLLARHLSKTPAYKPLTLAMTIQERIPFLGLALVAWFLPALGRQPGLVLTFLLLVWQGLGAGLAANPWQNLISRVIPGNLRASFFGIQSAVANLLASGSAIIAGVMLDRIPSPRNFAACFAMVVVGMFFSWLSLSLTREPHRVVEETLELPTIFWKKVVTLLRCDHNFRWFLASRMLSQFASMAAAFYTVYAVNVHGMSIVVAGVMTSVLLITQTIANPLLGWIADRWSRKSVVAVGSLCTALSALLALLSPNLAWFYLIFVFVGIGNTAFWTIGMALTLEFGSESDRPTYVGMANTLIAPATIIAPLIGGLLADSAGYGAAFIVSAAAGLITCGILVRFVRDPLPC